MSSLQRWEPERELISLQNAMRRLFDSSFILSPFFDFTDGGMGFALDMYETDDNIVVKASLPGVKPDDINVTVVGNTLTIRGETKAEEQVEEANYIRRERRYGRFSRSVTLPTSVDANKAKAEFENGILTLSIPKTEEAKPKVVEVKAKKS